MDKVKFDRLKGMMTDYQEEFEKQRSHPFVQAFNQCDDNTAKVLAALDEAIHEQVYAALNLGFVEGVSFAMDVMNISGTGENRELLEQFLEIINSDTDGSSTCYNSTIQLGGDEE